MKRIVAKFEIVTPMFLAGAKQESAELRVSSIKAELLFWWRALNYAKYVQNNPDTALADLHEDEVLIFGGPGGGSTPRQSSVQIKASWLADPVIYKVDSTEPILLQDGSICSDRNFVTGKFPYSHPQVIGPGIRYLAYGVAHPMTKRRNREQPWNDQNIEHYAGQLTRGAIAAGATFKVEFFVKLRPKIECKRDELISAIKVMGLLGGLGSRKRRGWGALSLQSLQEVDHRGTADNIEFELTSNRSDYEEQLARLLSPATQFVVENNLDISLSAFHEKSLIYLWSQGFQSNLEALEELGKGFQLYRAWGRNGRIIDPGDSRKNFKADHDWFKEEGNDRDDSVPERAALGLPLGFDDSFIVNPPEPSGRRSSPLMFHIAKIGQQYFPTATFFNTQFLPDPNLLFPNQTEKANYEYNPQVIIDYLENNKRTSTENYNKDYRYFDGKRVDFVSLNGGPT